MTTLTLSKTKGRDVEAQVFAVTRSMVTGTAAFKLRHGYRPFRLTLVGTASNAGTTATLSVGTSQANANEIVNAYDVKTAANGNGPTILPAVAGSLGQNPVGFTVGSAAWAGDVVLYVKYAETGGGSTVGSWILVCEYTTGETTR